jgi:hypothetical protein
MKWKGGEKMQKVIMWLAILAVMVLAVLNLVYDDRIPPDVVCPMANRNITWYYANKNP